jgi:hypothetical protein
MNDALQTVGDWNRRVEVPLQSALAASIEITGRSGKEACNHAITLMARTASKMTPQSRKRRTIQTDEAGRQYVEVWTQAKRESSRMFKDMFSNPQLNLKKTWEEALLIGNSGLAKRSWMWGLKKASGHRPIPGVVSRWEVRGEKECGVVVTNRLGYLVTIMEPGWEVKAATSATNAIMAQASKRLEREFGLEIPRAASKSKSATTLSEAWSKAS